MSALLFGQLKIIESRMMEENGEPYEEIRTWKERLFSRPWKPFKKTKTIVPKVPMQVAFKTPDGLLIMHPEMAAKLRREIELTK